HSSSRRRSTEEPDTKRGAVCGVGWEVQTNTPTKKESKVSVSKNSKLLSTSAKRIQRELADIALDPPPNCRAGPKQSITVILTAKELFAWTC
uniref:Uncharacterized protein n=1 Tax=Suricata suricatta TaxID=37032 RepID=A0A673V9P2_SURSU